MIFVSYSHSDTDTKDRVVKHLKAVTDATGVSVWEDKQIGTGDDWLHEIESGLKNAKAAVLLVNVDFLNSDFIRSSEVPQLLAKREQEGLKIFPLLTGPCNWKLYPWLQTMQLWPRDARPLSGMDYHTREESLVSLAAEIQKELALGNPLPRTHTPPTPYDETDHVLTTAIEAELLKARQEVRALSCSLYVVELNSNRKYLRIKLAFGPGSEKVQNMRIRSDQGLAGLAFQKGVSHLTNKLPQEKKFAPGVARKAEINPESMITVPVRDGDKKTLGVVQFINKESGQFEKTDKKLAEDFAEQVAPLVEKLLVSAVDSSHYEGIRECSVVFTDITNYGKVANAADLEIISTFLNQYLVMVCDKALEMDFKIDKFLGDGVMLIGNAPRERPEYALDSISLAFQIEEGLEDLLEEWKRYGADIPIEDLRSRIGISTGRVYLGLLGHEQARWYTAIGPSVNLAWRLLVLGDRDRNCIMICPRTYELAKSHCEVDRLELDYRDNSTEPGIGYRVRKMMNS